MAETIAIPAVGAAGQTVEVTLHPPAGAPTMGKRAARPTVLLCDAPLQAGEAAHELTRAIVASLHQAQLGVATFTWPSAETIDVYIDTARAACEALLERAEVDASRVGILGYSAGGVIAAALAGQRDDIARVALLSPTTAADLMGRVARSKHAAEIVDAHWRRETMRRSLKSISVTKDLAGRDGPALLLHGAADTVVPCEVSLAYLNAMEVAGRPVEHVLVARGDHFFTAPAVRAACLEQIIRFFGQRGAAETEAGPRARSA